MQKLETHPIQLPYRRVAGACMPTSVTLMAYEVYSHVYAPQEALITGGCRGGFGVGELIAFLYARNFPTNEWSMRVREVFDNMKIE